jgi:hypothetical protein
MQAKVYLIRVITRLLGPATSGARVCSRIFDPVERALSERGVSGFLNLLFRELDLECQSFVGGRARKLQTHCRSGRLRVGAWSERHE